MNDIEFLNQYIPFVDFFGQVCGSACQVVLYDASSPDSSIVAIHQSNSELNPGDQISDAIRAILDSASHSGQDRILNLYGVDGAESMFSAFFIKNHDRLIGILTIQKDVAMVNELESTFRAVLERFSLRAMTLPDNMSKPKHDNGVVMLLHNLISSEIGETGIHPSRLTLNEKVRLVHRLSDKGALMIDGAIKEIARQLFISEPTVYRYLNRTL